MSTTLSQEIFGVKRMLGDPLDQSPSWRQILSELEAEYQQMTNEVNNKANSQHIGQTILTTNPGQRNYTLSPSGAAGFYKALVVTTIPDEATINDPGAGAEITFSVNSGPGRSSSLEFVELEHINEDWAWLKESSGQLLGSSHDSQLIAFYKVVVPGEGERIRVELRPTPKSSQKYLVQFQLTDWWSLTAPVNVNVSTDLPFKMPHASQRMYTRALAALNLIYQGVVRWSLDNKYNEKRGKIVLEGLIERSKRYRSSYDEYIDSLDHADTVYVELFGDRL